MADSSPARQYAAFKRRSAYARTEAARFAQTLPFDLDQFQIEADEALEAGNNVLVAAPTGAGKTVVADFAVYLARCNNVKAFYTTPVKALSNQKYHDLVERYGYGNVGLLTGDNSINSEADIVVMTTEVLRNMLYEHSQTLRGLKYVILDEVHYLADPFRGPVWEEVIIHLPPEAKVIGLSATVSNVEDFCSWMESVRGRTRLVVSERRPVPLEQHVMLQSDGSHEPELIDLYEYDTAGKQTSKLNTGLISRLDQLDRKAERATAPSRRKRRNAHGRRSESQRYFPRRWAVVDELDYLGQLPGIYFIFSRNGCDQAVQQCLEAGLELTTQDEAIRIRSIVDEMVYGQFSHDDLKALGFESFRYALEEGFAPHHAGMVALFRQIVERLFEEGLVKVVFATETLALGINMPARCVVVEKLEKFNGTEHVSLTPGEYTQLTGRAGRRGIDSIGHAVVVDHRGFVPMTLAALSSKRVYPLHSQFKPTFNMAVNLLNSSDYGTSRETLEHSFAQWEANHSVGELQQRAHVLQKALKSYEAAFTCTYGNFKDFMENRAELSDLQKNGRRRIKQKTYGSKAQRERELNDLDERISVFKQIETNHPCRECPDLKDHVKWGNRWLRDGKALRQLTHRLDARTGSVAREFDSICAILEDLGYLSIMDRSGHERRRSYGLTRKGRLLRHIYSDYDLILAECIESGILDDLNPLQLASVLSAFVYEARRGETEEPRRYPGGKGGGVFASCMGVREVFDDVQSRREDEDMEALSELDFGLVDVIYDWADGGTLAQVLRSSELTGGDFVRNAKRLADLLQQLSAARPYYEESHPGLFDSARRSAKLVNRGIVAYSGLD